MCHHVDDAYDTYYEQLAKQAEGEASETPEHLSDDEPDVDVELLTDGGDGDEED